MKLKMWGYALLVLVVLTSCGVKETTTPVANPSGETPETVEVSQAIETTPVELNIAVTGTDMALTTVRQFYEQPTLDDTLLVNYKIYYSETTLQSDLKEDKIDLAILPIDFYLENESVDGAYKIVGLNASGYPQFVSRKAGVELSDLQRENINIYFSHRLFVEGLLMDMNIDPKRDVNIVSWTDEEKMKAAYRDGDIQNAFFSPTQYQDLLGEDVPMYRMVNMYQYVTNSVSLSSGLPLDVYVVRETVLDVYPEVWKAFEANLIENNNWLAKNSASASVYASKLDLVDSNFDYGKFLNSFDYYYAPIEVSKYKLKRYFAWLKTARQLEIKEEFTLYREVD